MKIYKTMNNGVQLVEYDDTIAGAIADMWNKSSDSWGGGNEISTAEQVIATHSGSAFFNIYVAMYNDEAVGYCSFDRYYKDANTLYVHVLNVRPDFHGMKVGKALVLLCVERTIELGYPRLDIHTWPGNTKAVPLYKKCGFLWEDRADTTHLSNFIPTVLQTELFGEFFKNADWYRDSTRIIEIKPDGVKVNKFEVYGYEWEKDGKSLAVGFEKTGRRIRYVETDDYKIEFIAENHELAFGLRYQCTFRVENKSGKELTIKINGKNDKGIRFDYEETQTVTDITEFKADFFVEPIEEELDTWRMHPSVVADVYINDKHAEFGLGIEPKFPLTVKLIEKRNVARAGMIEDVYINIKSALLQKASIRLNVSENGLTRFFEKEFTVETEPDGSTMTSTKAEILQYGYEKITVACAITLADGNEVSFSKPLHLINQGLDGMFQYENENEYGAVNGLWRVCLHKQNNHTAFYRITKSGHADFMMPKLGKPYNDEFNLLKPSDIRVYRRGEEPVMVMEADFASEAFAGVVLTEINEINAAGVITRHHRVKNTADKAMPLYLIEELWTSVGRRPVFHYDGVIQEIGDDMAYGFSNIHTEKIDENWIFDASRHNPAGVFWPEEYRPKAKWGDLLAFEHDLGEQLPGGCFETKPIVYMSGLFDNFKDFRNYVLGLHEEIAPYTNGYLDICLNARNPFVFGEAVTLVVQNNRLRMYEGELRLKSPDGLFHEMRQVNPAKCVTETNSFDILLNRKDPGVHLVELDLDFQSFSQRHKRALFIADRSSEILTNETDGVYTVSNGKLCFKAAPAYSDALYTMQYGDNEWLFSKYPAVEPYAWWNPFIGGIQSQLPNMSNSLVRREKITAEFVTVTDNFGLEWTGVKTIVSVNAFDEHRGMVYEQLYVTMPSLPVLCYFVRLINHTGIYKETGLSTMAFIAGRENLTDVYAHIKNAEKEEYRLRMGDETRQDFDRLAAVLYEGRCPRTERLYIYNDANRDNGNIRLDGDLNIFQINKYAKLNIPDKGSYTTRPAFFILTEKELPLDALTDLERIVFE